MPRTLWNEGRVVGLSAYECYLKAMAEVDPNADVGTEKEWLSSMVSMGSSMLLKINTSPNEVNGEHYIDIPFPDKSQLCAANTILASFFIGKGGDVDTISDLYGWCHSVESYGNLISNTSDTHPSGTVISPSDISVTDSGSISEDTATQLMEFAKITDGIIIQLGDWSDNAYPPPTALLKPNMSKSPTLRISFADRINHEFYILLTGFTNRTIISGVSGINPVADKDNNNGSFLGPAEFPWTAKVVFSVPPAAMSSLTKVMTTDMSAMQVYNTRYVWFIGLSPESKNPTTEDLKNVKSIKGIRVLTGHVSDGFINTYTVSYEDAVKACTEGKISDGLQLQKSYINQIYHQYGDGDRFRYIFVTNGNKITESGQQGMFYPVDTQTNKFEFTTTESMNMNSNHGFNFSKEGVTVDGVIVPPCTTDLLGGYWDLPINSDPPNTVSQPMAVEDGGYVFENHPVEHLEIAEYSTFSKPNTATPNNKIGDREYDSYISCFQSELLGSVIDKTRLRVLGINPDYADMTIERFMQYAATGRDMSMSIDTDYTGITEAYNLYIYKASDIVNIANAPSETWTWQGNTVYANAKMSANLSVAEFFRPAKLITHLVTVTDTTETEGENITDAITDSRFRLWAATAKSGKNMTQAISLIDDLGTPLSTVGTDGKIEADIIKWDDLLDGLNQNKHIDILGTALGAMKKSGSDYIQIPNGLRLYVSSTAPTDTDIPNGSVGLGWDGVKVYSGGSWK